jgi:molybdate transport system substrate-binding protein
MQNKIQRLVCLCAALLVPTMLISACHTPHRTVITLSAAASLQNSIVEIEAAYQHDNAQIDFRNNFGSSGTLAREIEDGAPADAFLSAASKPMDDLATKGLIDTSTRRNLLRNSLVLIAPLDSQLNGFDGLADKSVRLVAMGDPASVPAGQYARQTLVSMHIEDKLKSKLVLGKDVRQVLTYVETGNADAGLVYATDAKISDRIRVVAIAPESSHDPIIYPAAVVKAAHNDLAARRFIEFLRTPAAKAIFARHGFTIASS